VRTPFARRFALSNGSGSAVAFARLSEILKVHRVLSRSRDDERS